MHLCIKNVIPQGTNRFPQLQKQNNQKRQLHAQNHILAQNQRSSNNKTVQKWVKVTTPAEGRTIDL